MLYKEFKQKMEELGLFVEYNMDFGEVSVYAEPKPRVVLAIVQDDEQYDLSFCDNCSVLTPEVREELFAVTLEYARTPVEKRGQVKPKFNVIAYRQKLGTLNDITEEVYFYRRDGDSLLVTDDEQSNSNENQQWTAKQIVAYGLEDCERIEITNNVG